MTKPKTAKVPARTKPRGSSKPKPASKPKAKAPKKPEPNRSTPVMVGVRMSKAHAAKLRQFAKADDRSLVSYVGRLIANHIEEVSGKSK